MGISRKIQRGMKLVRSDGYAASEMMRAVSVCGSTEPSTRLMSLFIAVLLAAAIPLSSASGAQARRKR
jgi:hypothetical protein